MIKKYKWIYLVARKFISDAMLCSFYMDHDSFTSKREKKKKMIVAVEASKFLDYLSFLNFFSEICRTLIMLVPTVPFLIYLPKKANSKTSAEGFNTC